MYRRGLQILVYNIYRINVVQDTKDIGQHALLLINLYASPPGEDKISPLIARIAVDQHDYAAPLITQYYTNHQVLYTCDRY